MNNKSSFHDVLRLTDKDRQQILRELEVASIANCGPNLREVDRKGYHDKDAIIVSLMHPGGSVARVLAICRDISAEGLGFLNGGFVYQGTPCEFTLKTVDGEPVLVRGKVVRCDHVKGRVHDVGVIFDDPINVRAFTESVVRADDLVNEDCDPAAIVGNVLLIDDTHSDRQLMAFHMRSTGVNLTAVGGVSEARQHLAEQSFDLLLVDEWLDNDTGHELIAALRGEGFDRPIAAVTSDDRSETEHLLLESGADRVLTKPFRVDDLIKLLCEFLRSESVGEVLDSTMWSDPDARPLVTNFLNELGATMDELGDAIGRNDPDKAMHVCRQLRGACGSYGYPTLSDQAHELLKLIEFNAPDNRVREQLQQVRMLSEQARVRLRLKDADAA